jgi:hypothetical protein
MDPITQEVQKLEAELLAYTHAAKLLKKKIRKLRGYQQLEMPLSNQN